MTERPAIKEINGKNSAANNPFMDWLIRDAWNISSSGELLAQFCRCISECGVPLARVRLLIQTLHPQMFATSYNWLRGDTEASERRAPHDTLLKPEYQASPFAPILKGACGVRRRLDIATPQLDFPILEELKESGITDYVAMPLLFSDGLVNVISLATDEPGGFSTEDLGHIDDILPIMGRLFEVHAMRRTATTLLDTYIGGHTGEKVLNGMIRRGDGEDIHAVIWFCDLRGSTSLAESMSRADFLDLLNQFFDCTAGAVLEHGGEVLRFIGDATLAIFPTGKTADEVRREICSHESACQRSVAAAMGAVERIKSLNAERAKRNEVALDFGIGLHMGELTYGNIGTLERLEFTVIGAAANEAARIEDLTKTVGRKILISAEFAHCFPDKLQSLGYFSLRGIDGKREIFTLSENYSPGQD